MAFELNINKVKEEIQKLSNLEYVKSELKRLTEEIRQFDVQKRLSPTARKRLRGLESRYENWMRSLSKAQKQLDREFSKALRNIKKTHTQVQKRIDIMRHSVVSSYTSPTKKASSTKTTPSTPPQSSSGTRKKRVVVKKSGVHKASPRKRKTEV